jgi:hypothetical protein
MEAARQSKIAEMAEANESEKGVMFGGEKTWLIKIPISDIKIGPRFKVESSLTEFREAIMKGMGMKY